MRSTTTMQTTNKFVEGTPVVSGDGNELGTIERLVVDPSAHQISHLVLSKGFFFPEERVVPVDFVAAASEDQVTLDTAVELNDLPHFEQMYYLELDEEVATTYVPAEVANPLVWAYPAYGALSPDPMYSPFAVGSDRVERVRRNIPEQSVPVKSGATVRAADGTDVGKVAGIETDDHGSIAAITVDPGWFKDERTIPAHFITKVHEDLVQLGVGSPSLEAWRATH